MPKYEKTTAELLLEDGFINPEQLEVLERFDIIDGLVKFLNGNNIIEIDPADMKHITNDRKIVSVYTLVDGDLKETKLSEEEPTCGLIVVRLSSNETLTGLNDTVMDFLGGKEIDCVYGCSIDSGYTFGFKLK